LIENSERIPHDQDSSGNKCVEANHVVRESWLLNIAREKCKKIRPSQCIREPFCIPVNDQFEEVESIKTESVLFNKPLFTFLLSVEFVVIELIGIIKQNIMNIF
jgi:hypothetical protein